MKKKFPVITDEDKKCFLILWQWKLLSTTALKTIVYKNKSLYRTYVKLLSFEKKGYLKSVRSDDHQSSVWQLGDAGYEFIKGKIENTHEDGYKSEHKDHDFWVTAIHIGDWITGMPEKCGIFSEQQLRKIHGDSYPTWVPSLFQHRPDGWWSIGVDQPRDKTLIALEVELSKKSPMKYKLVGEFYSKFVSPYQVIWVVKSRSDINYIFNHLKSGSTTGASEQSFILLGDYIKSQWQSKIVDGKNLGKTLAEILRKNDEKMAKPSSGFLLLDVHKLPVESTTPKLLTKFEAGFSR